MKELTEKDLKCKNHVYISDFAGNPAVGTGFVAYGSILQGIKYLFHLPKLFIHQVFCPDNPILHERANYNYVKYDNLIGTYKYEMAKTMVIQIQKTKKKAITIIGI